MVEEHFRRAAFRDARRRLGRRNDGGTRSRFGTCKSPTRIAKLLAYADDLLGESARHVAQARCAVKAMHRSRGLALKAAATRSRTIVFSKVTEEADSL